MVFHIYQLKEEVSNFPNLYGLTTACSTSNIQVGWYLGIGFILGTLITLVFFLLISKYKTPLDQTSHFSSDI